MKGPGGIRDAAGNGRRIENAADPCYSLMFSGPALVIIPSIGRLAAPAGRVMAAICAIVLLATSLNASRSEQGAVSGSRVARKQVRFPGSTRPPAARGCAAAADGGAEVRALWVTRSTLVSPAAIARMVESARQGRFNTVFVQVRGRGDSYFNGGVEPRAQLLASQPDTFDPLQETIARAHAAGLCVHAWVNVNLVASTGGMPSSRAHVVFQHPEWLMVPRSLARDARVIDVRSPLYLDKLVRAARQQSDEVEGLYLSPIVPASVDYTASVLGDIAARYAIDGVHLDYVRYPTDDFDYGPRALAAFSADVVGELPRGQAENLRGRELTDPYVFTDAFPERWRQFRQDRLSDLVARVRAAVKSARPSAVLSAAVIPDADAAAATRLQDWRKWLEDKALDVVCPMAYASDAAGFSAQVSSARRAAANRPVWAGIGAYRLSSAQTIESILIARRLGVTGVILFSYDSLASTSPSGQSLSEIGRAVFDKP